MPAQGLLHSHTARRQWLVPFPMTAEQIPPPWKEPWPGAGGTKRMQARLQAHLGAVTLGLVLTA